MATYSAMMGCTPSPNPNPNIVVHARDLSQMKTRIGKAVEVEGLAGNAKSGAIIILDSGNPIYIDDLQEWPQSIKRKRVRATGTVLKNLGLHDPRIGGIQEDYISLGHASWEVVSKNGDDQKR